MAWMQEAKMAREVLLLIQKYLNQSLQHLLLKMDIAEIELIPISLGFEQSRARKGKPVLADREHGIKILQELTVLSSEFGTHITIQNGKGYIAL